MKAISILNLSKRLNQIMDIINRFLDSTTFLKFYRCKYSIVSEGVDGRWFVDPDAFIRA
jgi:hypothetical protein